MAEDKKAPARKTGVAAWNEEAGIETRGSAAAGSRHGRAQSEKRGRMVALALLALVCVACIVCLWPIKERITRGLWLREGTAVTMSVTDEEGNAASQDATSQAASAVSDRLGKVGLSEYVVDAQGAGSIVIKLPNTVDAEGLAKTIGGSGKVEFVRMDEVGDADALVKINAGTENVALKEGTYTPFMDGSSVTSAEVSEVSSGSYAITMYFDEEGKQTFADVTKELAENYGSIAIVVDGTVVTAPTVSEEISEGQVSISGDFTSEEANAMKALLESDVIPVHLEYEGTESIGPLAGKAGLWGLVGCAVAALVALAVASFARHGKLAIAVAGAMVVYAILMFGMMSVASRSNMFVLTVAGVVGGVVAAAVAGFAAWSVVDRFCAEVRGGKSVRGAATLAPAEALRPLALPCGVAFCVTLILLLVPLPLLRDVSATFVFGIVSGVLAIFWYELPLLRLLASGPLAKDAASWGLSAAPHGEATGSGA